MALRVQTSARANVSAARKKHLTQKDLAQPATFKSVLKTYGLTARDFKQVQNYVEKKLGHALAG